MHDVLAQILAAIGCAVLLVAILRRLSLPPVLGYLFVGIALGPHAFAVLEHSAVMELLGEIGIAFLLFSIGLEFSLPQFMSMRRVLLGLGGAQVLLGTLSGGFIAWWFGTPLAAAAVVGGALALSSTAIVAKQLVDQAELQERHGNLALGILLFQDLAAVPFLVMIPILAAGTEGGLAGVLAIALLKALVAFAVLLALGRYALRPLFHEVGSAHSDELFTVTVLFVTLAAAWMTAQLGLSLALGTFLAGMMLSETEYRHQIEIELRPFKDTLLGLFFMTVGMHLNVGELSTIWPWVLLILAGLVLGKGGLIALLVWGWGRNKAVALRTGAVLAHGGEFGFALLALALSTGLLNSHDAQPILAGIIMSMLLAPLMVRHNRQLAAALLPAAAAPPATDVVEIESALHDLSNHVVLCGFGRVGQQVAAVLEAEEIPYVAVDLHAASVKEAWEDGRKVFYGDATHREVLRALGAHRARALILNFGDLPPTHKALASARTLDRTPPLLVRCRDESNLEYLLSIGADEVIPETLETSLTLSARIMTTIGVPEDRIHARLTAVRDSRYRTIRDE